MSLSWRERHILVLGNARAALYQRRGEHCALLADCSLDTAAAPLSAALEASERLLGERMRAGRVEVVLSNRFVRFCLVPWSWDIGSPREQESLARHCLEEIYGQSAEGWRVRLSPEATGRLRLAAAMPEALLDGLRAQCAASGAKLASVQPYLMAAFNRFRRHLAHGDFLFVLAEPGRCALLLAQGGGWVRVRTLGLDDSASALALLVGRELELLQAKESAPQTLYLHAPGHADGEQLRLGNGAPRLLELDVAANDALHAMALTMVGA